jgi:hypothetical protein
MIKQPTANSQQPTSLDAFCLGGGVFSLLFHLIFSLFKPFRRFYYHGLRLDYCSLAFDQHSLTLVHGSPLSNCIGLPLFQHRPIVDHGSPTFVHHSLLSNHSRPTIDHSRPTLDRIGITARHGSLMLQIKTLFRKNKLSINF